MYAVRGDRLRTLRELERIAARGNTPAAGLAAIRKRLLRAERER